MELLWLYILLGAVLKLSSGIAYNKREVSTSSFACYTDIFANDTAKFKAIKLYLPRTSLKVICHLYNINEEDTKENRRKNLLLYSSAGLAPSIQIFNSTYSKVFFFETTLGKEVEEVVSWSINIPREKITYNTDIAPVEEWFVKFNMHHGLGMFTTEGTLLDIMREPILQWIFRLGTYVVIEKTISDIKKLKVAKSPCASDVAIAGVIYNKKDNGIVIGVTYDGFMSRDVIWQNLTNNICVLMDYDCSGLALVDIILTNTRLILLTTLGLFVSEDLRYPSKYKLKFNKPALCGFEMDDYYTAKIWYNLQCLANRENYEVDYVSLSFNKDKTLSQESTCFYSNDSFTKWHSCLPHKTQAEKHISRRVVSFLVDYEQNTGIALLSQKDQTLVSVHKLTDDGALNKKTKFPPFIFPGNSLKPTGLFFHQGSHFVYVYGNQIWGSFDGGNTFIPLIILINETIVNADSCVYTQGIVYVSDKANIYYTKAGVTAYTFLTTMPLGVFSMYFDHLGILNHISFNSTSIDGLSVSVVDMNTLMEETDLGFDGPLSPHYVTEEQMLFFHYGPPETMPTFTNLQNRKRIDYLPGGSGVINTIFPRMNPKGIVSSILVDVLEHFPIESVTDSPCTANTLTILPTNSTTTVYQLVLSTAGTNVFKASDVEKTVVIPGTSSFFITEVLDDLNALGITTLPEKMLLNYSFPPDEWFMYDFGTTNGRKWKIVVDTCRHIVQQFDDLPLHAIKYLDLGQQLSFSFRVTPVNTAFIVFHQYMMRVLIGRPNLLDMTAADYWDDNHSYVFNIIVRSKFFEQGKTTVAVVMPYASLLCDVVCIILTLKSSCSYLKVTHYVLPYKLSPSDWLSPENTFGYNNSEISKYLKVLPVNYRPPSVMGIAVPLTDNFYNADPSKPRMRDYFEGSKKSGKYKQCANKSSRAKCKCADYMKLSFSVAFSDCKEKALRMKFPVVKLPLYFVVEDEGHFVNLTSPYFVTIKEVNNRTNWIVSGTNETFSLVKLRLYLEKKVKTKLYNPDGLTISISGSELFHFRVSTIPGVSFCNLFDEFQIYVDDSPLAFPGQYLISTVVAVSIGGILFMAFLLHIYEIQIVNFFKRKKPRNKVESKTSVASEASYESNES
ncbi:cation channel sperm-associated auxiliary subunit beta [Pituophis catenifer annectens]|uniref:cation channel sperm-associated auxiliary subunit beta n=1 Tax=Pituophis catenifer annectens TaxID=94852 RepID=UPI0039912B9F